MNTYQRMSIPSEIEGNEPLSENALAYICERVHNNYYHYVLRKFLEAAKKDGLTKAELARRINSSPDIISRLLGAPGNWTIDTVTKLLVGICREENPHSMPYLGRAKRNRKASDRFSNEAESKGPIPPDRTQSADSTSSNATYQWSPEPATP